MDGRYEDVPFVGKAATVYQADSSCAGLRGVFDDSMGVYADLWPLIVESLPRF